MRTRASPVSNSSDNASRESRASLAPVLSCGAAARLLPAWLRARLDRSGWARVRRLRCVRRGLCFIRRVWRERRASERAIATAGRRRACAGRRRFFVVKCEHGAGATFSPVHHDFGVETASGATFSPRAIDHFAFQVSLPLNMWIHEPNSIENEGFPNVPQRQHVTPNSSQPGLNLLKFESNFVRNFSNSYILAGSYYFFPFSFCNRIPEP